MGLFEFKFVHYCLAVVAIVVVMAVIVIRMLCFVARDVTPRYVSAEFDRYHNVELDCSDTARPSDLVTWSKDGRELREDHEYLISDSGTVLTVRNVRSRHAGQYECQVIDGATEAVIGRQTFILLEAGLCCSVRCPCDVFVAF